MRADPRWTSLVEAAGVIGDDGIVGIVVVRAGAGGCGDDVALCDADQAEARAASMRSRGTGARASTSDRAFLSRTLREDPETAVAHITRAAVAAWIAARGATRATDPHERRALALAEAQLAMRGHPVDDEITRHKGHLARDRAPTPVCHADPGDVVRKAVARLARQIAGRVVVVP